MIDILFENSSLLVVNKPTGVFVHPSSYDRSINDSVLRRLQTQGYDRLYPVHRLDRPTSGVLVLAKDHQSCKELAQQFAKRQVIKEYLALVRGRLPERGTICHSLKPLNRVNAPEQTATTHFRCLKSISVFDKALNGGAGYFSLALIQPKEGRQHQIRRHFKHMMHPIVGDRRYGKGPINQVFAKKFASDRLLLHAYRLCFLLPGTEQLMNIEAPAPSLLKKLLERHDMNELRHPLNDLEA